MKEGISVLKFAWFDIDKWLFCYDRGGFLNLGTIRFECESNPGWTNCLRKFIPKVEAMLIFLCTIVCT